MVARGPRRSAHVQGADNRAYLATPLRYSKRADGLGSGVLLDEGGDAVHLLVFIFGFFFSCPVACACVFLFFGLSVCHTHSHSLRV